MRTTLALTVHALALSFLSGCNPQPPSPSPKDVIKASQQKTENAVKIMEEINKSNAASGKLPPGAIVNVNQAGSHRVRIISDVPASQATQDEKATLTLGKRTLVLDFDEGRVVLDDEEKAKLPDKVKEVEVRYVEGKLSLSADGAAVPIPDDPK